MSSMRSDVVPLASRTAALAQQCKAYDPLGRSGGSGSEGTGNAQRRGSRVDIECHDRQRTRNHHDGRRRWKLPDRSWAWRRARLRSDAEPRAACTPHPADPAIGARSASRRALPMPALPSITTNRPQPFRDAPASASSTATWASRSSSSVAPEGCTLADAITSNPSRPSEPQLRDAFGVGPDARRSIRVQSLRRENRESASLA